MPSFLCLKNVLVKNQINTICSMENKNDTKNGSFAN